MTGKQIPSLFPWLREVLSGVVVWKEKEHTLDQICEMGAMCLAAAGWSHLPAPHRNCRVTVSSLLSLPLWFIAARRLCVWRWHKSHQKERRKFAFIPFLAYWMQLSSLLLKSWAGLGQEGQALALVLSMAKAGLAALPEEAPMTSNSHIQQLYLHWMKSTAIFKKQRMNKENIGNYCLWDYIFTGSPSVFSLAKNKLATRQTKNCKRGRRKNSGHNMLISSKSWRLSAHLCFCTGWWLQIAHWSNGGSKELITVPRPNLASSHRQHLLRSHWGRKDWTRDSGDCEGEKN